MYKFEMVTCNMNQEEIQGNGLHAGKCAKPGSELIKYRLLFMVFCVGLVIAALPRLAEPG